MKYDVQIGERFGSLVTTEVLPDDGTSRLKYVCKCDCGGIKIASAKQLLDGKVIYCDSMIAHDITGKSFGRLTAIRCIGERIGAEDGTAASLWECVCACGETVQRTTEELMIYSTRMCDNCREEINRRRRKNLDEPDPSYKLSTKDLIRVINRQAGYRVIWHNRSTGKYASVVVINGKRLMLGPFDTLEDALTTRESVLKHLR